ncbi:MAG: S-layer homology domain-containing protein [Oscillospiraceae bacterium]|nr:S-layer homology domain-containing protein [Oscillospiraceae bacterium]
MTKLFKKSIAMLICFVMVMPLLPLLQANAVNRNATSAATLVSALSSSISGDTVTVTSSFTVSNLSITIPEGVTLYIRDERALTFSSCTIRNNGTIQIGNKNDDNSVRLILNNSILDNHGTITMQNRNANRLELTGTSQLDNHGTIILNGGEGRISANSRINDYSGQFTGINIVRSADRARVITGEPCPCEVNDCPCYVCKHVNHTAATCMAPQTCNDCEEVLAPALGHKWKWVTTKSPTCTKDGVKIRVCQRQGCDAKGSKQSIKRLGHNWGDWRVVTPAGENEDGTEARKCKRCGEKQFRDIHRHHGKLIKAVIPPTCEDDGFITFSCRVCDYYKIWYDEGSAGHDYVGVDTAPKCTEDGYTTFTCSVCGDFYEEDGDEELGHLWGPWERYNSSSDRRYCQRQGCNEFERRTRITGGSNQQEPQELDTAEVKELLTDDHIWYMRGYEGNNFLPDNKITRAEAVMAFFRLLKEDARLANSYDAKKYPDIKYSEWYGVAINALTNLKIVQGDTNGYFRPNDEITRAEMAVLISNFYAFKATSNVSPFSDVTDKDYWAYDYIIAIYSKGWVKGYDGKYNPESGTTRIEFVTMVNRFLNRHIDNEVIPADAHKFNDVAVSYWGYRDLLEATHTHIFTKEEGSDKEIWTKIIETGMSSAYNK